MPAWFREKYERFHQVEYDPHTTRTMVLALFAGVKSSQGMQSGERSALIPALTEGRTHRCREGNGLG